MIAIPDQGVDYLFSGVELYLNDFDSVNLLNGNAAGYIALGFLLFIFVTLKALELEEEVPLKEIPLSAITYLTHAIGGIGLGLLALTRSRADYLHWLPWFPAKAK